MSKFVFSKIYSIFYISVNIQIRKLVKLHLTENLTSIVKMDGKFFTETNNIDCHVFQT